MNLPHDPAGWLISEKLDGCRCLLTESGKLLSRNGRDFRPPAWFMRGMPQGIRLDGELWIGRGTFPDLVSSIQTKGGEWQGIRFMVFDLAELGQPIEARLAKLSRLPLPPQAALVSHRVCTGWHDLDSTESATVANGGEGLCLRAPGSFYRPHGFAKCKRLFPDLDRSTLD